MNNQNQQTYNEVDISTADKLLTIRMASQTIKKSRHSMQEKFPPNNRPGLGVALAYERMGHMSEWGNQPVTERIHEYRPRVTTTSPAGIQLRIQVGNRFDPVPGQPRRPSLCNERLLSA